MRGLRDVCSDRCRCSLRERCCWLLCWDSRLRTSRRCFRPRRRRDPSLEKNLFRSALVDHGDILVANANRRRLACPLSSSLLFRGGIGVRDEMQPYVFKPSLVRALVAAAFLAIHVLPACLGFDCVVL